MRVEISNEGNVKKNLLCIALRFCNDLSYCANIKSNHHRRRRGIERHLDSSDKGELIKSVPYGRHEINYKGNTFWLNNKPQYPALATADYITVFNEVFIECENDQKDIIDDFLLECVKIWDTEYNERIKSTKERIKVLIWDDYWEDFYTRPTRSLDSISLDFKDDLLNDIKHFLSEETELKYRRIGRPYHRNYLLEGIPGTGKTSLIYSLASELNMSIAIINFTVELNDTKFMRAIQRLPEKSILVLEDIDHLFIERKKNDDCKNAVTFSGILNALDGFVSQDKLITFLTTNHKCHLDNALIRPGRIAKQYHFDYATKTQIEHMYKLFFPERDDYETFYKEIKHLKLTTAILQSFLFQHMEEPNIIDYIDELKKSISENKYEENKNLYS